MYSDFAVNIYLHTAASGWIFINNEVELGLTSSGISDFEKYQYLSLAGGGGGEQ